MLMMLVVNSITDKNISIDVRLSVHFRCISRNMSSWLMYLLPMIVLTLSTTINALICESCFGRDHCNRQNHRPIEIECAPNEDEKCYTLKTDG
jgi:hypothetical protein